MSDEPHERMTHLAAEIERVPIEEREALIAMLSQDDRTALWDAQLRLRDGEADPNENELGGGD